MQVIQSCHSAHFCTMLQQTFTNFSFSILILTVPQLRQLVTMPVYVEFVLDSVTMRQVSLPCQYHSTIIPYSFSIHLSMTLYAHRENACLILILPSSLLLYSFTPITLQQLFFYVLDFRPLPQCRCEMCSSMLLRS